MKKKNSTYVIAEIGINHGGNLSKAKKLIDSAKSSNANAVKFQTYITEKRVSKNSPIFDILKKSELSHEDHYKLVKYSKNKKIDFITTPFDQESFDFLYKELKIKTFKIASFDITNIKYLKYISKFNVTIILSLGMANLKEIDKCVNIFKKQNAKLIILHCISAYPISNNQANLSNISFLKNRYNNLKVGYSDHTKDIQTSILAVAAGAEIIEKHFMLINDNECIDFPVSIDINQMKNLIIEINKVEDMFKEPNFEAKNVEKNTLQFRRFS